jgi:DNA repair exonuclease SbcCD ATPase subunit
MRTKLLRVCALIALISAGCASRHPLTTSEQAKRIQSQNKAIKAYAGTIQDRIRTANTSGALVVVERESSHSPTIIPTNDPLDGTADNLTIVQSGDDCIFVFRSEVALEPESSACSLLAARANERASVRMRLSEEDAQVQSLRVQIDDLTKKTAEEILTLDTHIQQVQAGVTSLGEIVAPSVKLIGFHEQQLKLIESSLNVLKAANQKTAGVIAQNNKQIDQMIADLNTALNQTKQSLDQIQQKLATIK